MYKGKYSIFLITFFLVQNIFAVTPILTFDLISGLENSLLNTDIPAVESDFFDYEILLPTVLNTEDLGVNDIGAIITFAETLDVNETNTQHQVVLGKLQNLYYLRFREYISQTRFNENIKTNIFRTLRKLYDLQMDARTVKTGLTVLFLNKEIVFKISTDRAERAELMSGSIYEFEELLVEFGLMRDSRLLDSEFQNGLTNRDVYVFLDLLRDNVIAGNQKTISAWGVAGIVVAGVVVVGGVIFLILKKKRSKSTDTSIKDEKKDKIIPVITVDMSNADVIRRSILPSYPSSQTFQGSEVGDSNVSDDSEASNTSGSAKTLYSQ